MCTRHGGHTRELHAVLNDVVDFAVAHPLGEVRVQVRDTWIFVCSNRRATPTIDPMAKRASGNKKFSSLCRSCVVVGERVGKGAFASWDCKIAKGTRYTNLDCRRGRRGAKTTPLEPEYRQRSKSDQNERRGRSDLTDSHCHGCATDNPPRFSGEVSTGCCPFGQELGS